MIKLASPRGIAIYELLQSAGTLTAAEIAAQLGILPNSVYRDVKQLLEIGFVEKTTDYPVKFSAQPSGPEMSFLRTRDELLTRTDRDAGSAKKSISFIVSGLEVPAETVLAYKRAIDRGVNVRALLQKRSDTSSELLGRWLGIGLDARYTGDLGLRMFIFDSRVVYLTSYSQERKADAFGLRFEYVPLAVLTGGLFEQKWEAAVPLASSTARQSAGENR